MASLAFGADIITVPSNLLMEWGKMGMPIPDENYIYDSINLEDLPYQRIDLNKSWKDFNISHELTDKGLARFASDWNSLIG